MDADPKMLVHAIKKRPALYDKNHRQYFNRHYVNQQWREIGEELGVDGSDARKRWTILRDYFQKQARSYVPPTPTTKSRPTTRKWYLYDEMEFLLPYLRGYEGKMVGSENGDEYSVNDDTCEDAEHYSDENSQELNHNQSFPTGEDITSEVRDDADDEPSTEKYRKLTRTRTSSWRPNLEARLSACGSEKLDTTSLMDVQMQMLQLLEEMGKKLAQTKCSDDSDELFLKSLLPVMKVLDPIPKMECQLEIHSVLMNYVRQSDFAAQQKKQDSSS